MEPEENMNIEGVESVVGAFHDIADRAGEYFQKVAQALAGVSEEDPYGSPRDAEFFWSKLPNELQIEAKTIVGALVQLVRGIIPLAQRSPALTDADQRDIGFVVKEMRAALQLRHYRHWDIEVLHDEGTVLGVQPSGQSEDKPLHPERASKVFSDSADRLKGILELLTPGSLIPGAVAPSLETAQAYRLRTAFIMMWMNRDHPELDDLADTVKRCFKGFGIDAVRADDIEHEDVITKRILDEIKSAEFLFADLTGERPSVYYEVGYAHAIGRRVMLFRKKGTKIHFDLAAYNCPEYENLRDLEQQLNKRLENMTGERHRDKPRSKRKV